MELRYSELKYNGQIYTEQWKIDEILISNKFNWMVNAEIKNARLEIFQDTLVWNAGIWYNGDWYFGVWRDGEWRYGTWQNGVWYNGVWRDGTFKSGIIYNGKFFKGKIEKGEIRGGIFIDTQIFPEVIEYTGDEYQVKKEKELQIQQPKEVIAQPTTPLQNDKVRVTSTPPASQQPVEQPKIQQENNQYNMKHLKTFETFEYEPLNEGFKSFIQNIGKGLGTALEKMEDFLGKPYFNKIKKQIDGLSKEEQEHFLEETKKTLEKGFPLIWVFTILTGISSLSAGSRTMIAVACIFYFVYRYKVDIQKGQLKKLLAKIENKI